MMKSDKRITNYLSVIAIMLVLSIQLSAQSGDCATDYTLNFTDAGNDWHVNDVSGSYAVGAQTFDIAIDDADHILESTNESNEGLEVRIDPHDRADILTITYTLSETANSVSFPIADLDKKSGGSDQQEQVCVTGYLGNNPIAIMPVITSLDGHVAIDGNCATATTNSATSGQDESVFVEFNQCIDRIVIEYGSGPMAPHDPTASKIYIGEGSGFTANVCNTCDENCTSENVLDFTDSGQHWIDGTIGGIYTAGTQTYTINLVDDDGILETNAEDGPFSSESHEGIRIGINPHSKDDVVTACYALSEVSNRVYFKIRDLDKKSGGSDQQEQVCVYATLGDDPTVISPILTSLDGSVMISETADGIGCATATTNSAISHQEESVLVEFDECIDKIFIVYGSGPMAPDNPTYSAIYIGEEFGFYTGVCGDGCTTATCDADAGTLTLNGGSSDICITGGDGQVSATPDGNANVPAGYEVLYVLTSGSGLVIEAVGANPAFVIEESGDYTIHTLVYDPGTLDLSIVELGVTTGFQVNSLLIQGGGDICASLDVAGAPFSADLPRAGILTADVTAFCIDGSGSTDISATPAGVVSVPDGYEVLYVLTSGNGLVIEGVSNTPAFAVDGTGRYTIHTLVYDPNTLDLSGVEIGVTTGFDVNNLLTQGGGDICGALDVTGAVFNIQDVSAGTLSLNGDENICLTDGSQVSATPNGDAIIPPGYQVGFVLTQGADLVIVDLNNAPSFDIEESGTYTIHTLVYDPTTLDLSGVELGVTTGFEVNSLLVQGGGDVCASLDVGGARFTAEVLNTGDLTPVGASNLCFSSSGTMLMAMADGGAIVPAGYELLYVLTSGDGLVIEAVSDTPEFMVDGTGLYTIHTLVYDPTTLDLGGVEFGVTTGFDVNAALAQGGGEVCGALDVAGASFVIDNPNAGQISPASTAPICTNLGIDIPIEGIPDGTAVVPPGYSLIYVLTSGADLTIEGVNAVLPQFNVSDNGIYTIHTLVYNPATLDLSSIVFGTTTGFDVNALLVQGGGSICGALDVTGASFELITCLRDNDLDDDGISNIQEGNGVDPSADDDNDGLANYEDPDYPGFEDINSDGINDRFDQDLDGIPDILDIDSDNDGVADIIEAGGSDANGDGLVDNFVDADEDGWADIYDTDDDTTPEPNDGAGTALPHSDDDGDGLPNSIDLDSDSDGVADIVEAGGMDMNGDGLIDNPTDSDGDGYADMVDTDNNNIEGPNDGGTALPSPDSDGDGRIDALDLDSDNDGVSDLAEAGGQDINGDGQLDIILDADGDGLANLVDTDNNNIEGPNDGGTALPSKDSDGDGLLDAVDLDSDNDGVADIIEAGGMDSNGDGYIDNLADVDGDGYADMVDTDNNNIIGSNDGGTALPNKDTDGDGLVDAADLDSDNDGVADIMEAGGMDANGDGVIDNIADVDGDGYADMVDTDNNSIEGPNDGGMSLPNPDSDGDGSADVVDLDSDNDGLSDLFEADGKDVDGNGQVDDLLDSDGDGFADIVDTDNNNIEGPNDGGSALPSPDLDGDGIINRLDLDSDNDGLSDLSESIGDIAIIMAIDPDGMGTISGMDMDKDGIIDGMFDDDMDLFGGSLTIAINTDGDFNPNHLDIDSDGDGIVDITEGQPTLNFVIPLGGENADVDADGINDAFDSNKDARGGFDISAVDTDNDGIPDYLDLDSDDDGESDAIEGFDFNGDGEPELPLSGIPGDPDNDGLDGIYDEVTDVFDQTNNETYAIELADADGGTLERDFRSAFSINIIVYLSGALIDLNNNAYLTTMRSDLNERGLLPGQTLIGLGTPTPAGQPYNREPWNYTGTEGADWTNAQYEQIAEFTGSEVVDWVLVSFRRDFTADSRIARFAGLVLEDGRVVFPQDFDLSGEEQLYILVEHRNHMAAMTPEPIMVNAGRIFYDFTLGESYIGPDPANPLGAGQLEVVPGVFALYNSDGEQVTDATQAQNPSYNITGADKTVWQPQNGTFNIYQSADYNLNGDTNGADIIPFSFFSGVFSVVPR